MLDSSSLSEFSFGLGQNSAIFNGDLNGGLQPLDPCS